MYVCAQFNTPKKPREILMQLLVAVKEQEGVGALQRFSYAGPV